MQYHYTVTMEVVASEPLYADSLISEAIRQGAPEVATLIGSIDSTLDMVTDDDGNFLSDDEDYEGDTAG